MKKEELALIKFYEAEKTEKLNLEENKSLIDLQKNRDGRTRKRKGTRRKAKKQSLKKNANSQKN